MVGRGKVAVLVAVSLIGGCSNPRIVTSTAPRLSLCNLPEVSEPVVLDAYFVAPDFETMVLADPACPGEQNRVVRIASTVNRNAVRFIAREAHAGRPFGRSVRARVEGRAQLAHGERYFLVGSVSQLSIVQYQLPQEIPPPPQ